MGCRWRASYASLLTAYGDRHRCHREPYRCCLPSSRALGSQRCEEEATDLLLEQDWSVDDINQVLTHLSSPMLSDIEQLLVSMARETVWYQPAQIQRRCAELQAQLSNEQFLDFCGAVSLLNTVCRLEVIVDLRA